MTHQTPLFHYHDPEAIQRMIDYQGFALFSGGGRGGWTHTIGLYDPRSRRPELFIWGLTPQLREEWLLDLGFQAQGPLSLRQLIEAAEEGSFAGSNGKAFEAGRVYRFAQGELPGLFGVVETRYYEEYLWHARAYHRHEDFPVLQFTWSDPSGRFPFDEKCDPPTRLSQRLLFDPKQYLPLLDEG